MVVRSSNLDTIRMYFPYIDNLISIRRSTASALLRNQENETISLESMMPTRTVKTVEVKYLEDEKPEMQWTHRAAAR
jgi:hypothetical protein